MCPHLMWVIVFLYDGQIVIVNWDGLWVPFMAYHIELVIDYDII